MCGRQFRTPQVGFEKKYTSETDKATGREIPAEWHCATRQTRLNNVADYRTPSRMTKEQAVAHFIGNLRLTFAPAAPKGRLTVGEALAYYERALTTHEIVLYRKVEMREDLALCRGCYRKTRNGGRRGLDIVHVPKGTSRTDATNPKPAPKRAKVRKEKKPDVVQFWFCTTPSTRDEPSRSVKTPTEMTEHDAREYFRYHLSRLNLSGCSVTG